MCFSGRRQDAVNAVLPFTCRCPRSSPLCGPAPGPAPAAPAGPGPASERLPSGSPTAQEWAPIKGSLGGPRLLTDVPFPRPPTNPRTVRGLASPCGSRESVWPSVPSGTLLSQMASPRPRGTRRRICETALPHPRSLVSLCLQQAFLGAGYTGLPSGPRASQARRPLSASFTAQCPRAKSRCYSLKMLSKYMWACE